MLRLRKTMGTFEVGQNVLARNLWGLGVEYGGLNEKAPMGS